MWFLFRILAKVSQDKVLEDDLLVGIEGDERGIQNESGPLSRYKEQGREECVSDVFRQDKLAR